MKYHQLGTDRQKKTKRPGRGISGGRGKTAGRGTKGQGARKSALRRGFEGGQTPLYMRLPKLRGFRSHLGKSATVYTSQLDLIKKKTVDPAELAAGGLVESPFIKIKLIYNGEIKSQKTIKVQAASQAAIKAVDTAGGKVELIEKIGRPAKAKRSAQETDNA